MGIIICRDNDKDILEDQILGSPVKNQFQKDAGSQSLIYYLIIDKQIILYSYILLLFSVSNLFTVNLRLEICC